MCLVVAVMFCGRYFEMMTPFPTVPPTVPNTTNYAWTLEVAKQCKWFDGPHGDECNPLQAAQSVPIPVAHIQQCAKSRISFRPRDMIGMSFKYNKEIHYCADGDDPICSDLLDGCTIPISQYVRCPPDGDHHACFFDSISCLAIPIITPEQVIDLEQHLGYRLSDAYTFHVWGANDPQEVVMTTSTSPRLVRSLALRNLDALLDNEVALSNTLSPPPQLHKFYNEDNELPVFTSYLYKADIESRVANVGDFSSYPIVQHLLDYKAHAAHTETRVNVTLSSTFEAATPAFLSALGSIIDAAGEVPWALKAFWGSGLIGDSKFKFHGVNLFYGVRGPWSRRYLALRHGINTPVVKDPGLLLPAIVPRPHYEESEMIEIGLFLHEVDYPVFEKTRFATAIDSDHVVSNWGHFDKTIAKLLRFKRIISSSLHGVIFAHAYGIPCLSLAFGDKVIGGDFKFVDYYHSIGYDQFEGRVDFLKHDGDNVSFWIDMVDRYWQPAQADLNTTDLYRFFPFGGLDSPVDIGNGGSEL